MNRSLAMGLALAAGVTLSHVALAQSPFPPAPPAPQQSSPPPPQQQSSPFPQPPPQSAFPAASQQSVFPSGPMQGGPPMGGMGGMGGPPQQSSLCANFPILRDDAKSKADVVSAVGKRHGDRKEMCTAVQSFTVAEEKVVKFLDDNKTACGVPAQAVAQAKAMHVNTLKFRDTVCAEGPTPKVPTLSDAIGTPPAETGTNTKTGRGTLDTLTGNPLAK
jgi:hypothetical protein